jgi:four helix bundle protein
MQHSYSFEKLEVWKKAKDLATKLYAVTSSFPQEEKFGIVSQIRRAAVSVASNIAEGSSRTSTKDQAHFSQIAFGSLMEVLCQITIANELEFLSNEDMANFRQSIDEVARMLNSLRKSQINKVEKMIS